MNLMVLCIVALYKMKYLRLANYFVKTYKLTAVISALGN